MIYFADLHIFQIFTSDYLDFNSNFFNILLVEGTLVANNKLGKIINTYLKQDQDLTNYYRHHLLYFVFQRLFQK